jgi:hypothetical protein
MRVVILEVQWAGRETNKNGIDGAANNAKQHAGYH